MYANLHRHHGMGVCGNYGGLLLLVSVPSRIARAAGDERDSHDTGDHQIAALGRHLTMTNLGFVCRGADGRGISPMAMVSSTTGAEPKPGSSRVSDSSTGKSPSRRSHLRVGFRLAIALVIAFFDIGFIASILDVVARIRYAIARRVLHVGDCLVKRNFVQRKPV